MNIFVIIVLLSLQDIPELPAAKRADRRAARSKAIAHNRRVYNDIIGPGIWFDEPEHDEAHYRVHCPEEEGLYVSYKGAQKHSKSQQSRWETHYFKTRSIIDTGRVHAGDKHRKGKRAYRGEHVDKTRARQLWVDYVQYGE